MRYAVQSFTAAAAFAAVFLFAGTGCTIGQSTQGAPMIGVKLLDEKGMAKLVDQTAPLVKGAADLAAPFLPPPFNVIVPGAASALLGLAGWRARAAVHDASDKAWDEATSHTQAVMMPPPERTFTPPSGTIKLAA